MSAEQAATSDVVPFEFGPPPKPQETAPWSPEMARSMAATIAQIEAQELKRKAEMETPEGRRKAAKGAEADRAEKRRRWGSRVCASPLHGFIGIFDYDSAKDKELQIYTRTYDLKHKFWGIKPAGMTVWDFWDIHDPEVTRYHHANHEIPANTEKSVPPTDLIQHGNSNAKSRKRQSVNIDLKHKVSKLAKSQTKSNKNRKTSSAHKVDSRVSVLGNIRTDEIKREAGASSKSTRNKMAITASGSEQDSRQAKPTGQGNIISPQPKKGRGHPPAKEKSTKRKSNQEKTSVVKGNARVTKSSRKGARPLSAPSTHQMRTRRAGPVESL